MGNETPVSTPMAELLNRIYAAIDFMANLEGQDPTLVIEMSQAMITDVTETGGLASMLEYVQKFCDVIDSAEDAERIAADIRSPE